MSVSLERLARNQALFREVNERLLEMSDGSPNGRVDFLCECSGEECAETIDLSLDEYNEIRSDPRMFVICVGHETLEVEHVVDTRPGHAVVKKTNGAAFAAATDPRAAAGRRE